MSDYPCSLTGTLSVFTIFRLKIRKNRKAQIYTMEYQGSGNLPWFFCLFSCCNNFYKGSCSMFTFQLLASKELLSVKLTIATARWKDQLRVQCVKFRIILFLYVSVYICL